MHNQPLLATVRAIRYLLPLLTEQQRTRLGQLAIDNGISVREYLGRLAARHGMWQWVEVSERRPLSQWPIAFGEEIR